MGRVKQKPIMVIELNSSSTNTANQTPAPPTPSLPAPAPRFIPPKPANVDVVMGEASRDGSEEQSEPAPAVDHSTPIPPTEPLLSCPVCSDTFPSSHRDQFREHVESCAANGLGNESDEESAALSTPPASDSNPADRFPCAYSNEVETYPAQHEDDTEADEAQPKFRLAKLTELSEFQDALDEAEEGSKEDHFRALQGIFQALAEYQDEWLELDKVIKTSRYPNTISIEDEIERDKGRVRGFIRDPIKPTQRVINPRAKPVRPDDPEKWYYTNQFQLDQDKTEAAVYGYIVKESARDIGHQDPIGQRPRGPGQNRDLRVRQPPRNTIGDGDSGDESGLNAVDEALMEGGRGKREKRPSNRVMGTNSRASSAEAKPAKQPRKNAKSRLAELEADPSAAENLDSTQRWANDVDAAGERQPGDDSDSSEDEAGVAKPHKGPKSSYLDKPKKAAKRSKNADSINGELDDDEVEAAKKARSQKRSEGAKMGWAKRKEALAAKESSTQASINGDDDEGNRSELAKQEPNDASDANSAPKPAPKKKEKKMMQLADGTWIEKPSAATINMRRRWQKKREAEAKGLPPPKIGRYKKTDVPSTSDTPNPANFDDVQNNEVLAAVDRANSKRKQGGRHDSEQIDDENQDDGDKKGSKAVSKRRKKNIELSEAMILDEDTVNDNTLELEDDDLDAQQPFNNKGKRAASSELGGPANKRPRNPESLVSSDDEDEATEFEDLLDPSSSPKKRTKTKGSAKGTKKTKGTHKKSKATAVSFPDILSTTSRRTTPKLGSFVRRGSTVKPIEEDASMHEDENDEELENQTTEDERPPLRRFGGRPSGFSFEVDDLPPGHPLLAQAPLHGGPTFGPSLISGPLNALPNPPGPSSMDRGHEPSMGFFTPLERLVAAPNTFGSTTPMDPFLAPYTQSNPHPPVYSRNPSSDHIIPRHYLPARNENVKPSESAEKRANGPADKSMAQALNLVDARDLELAGGALKAPKPFKDNVEEESQPRAVRRSNRSRKAPAQRNDYAADVDSEDIYHVSSSPPKSRLPRKPAPSRPSNRFAPRPSRVRNSNGQFEKTGMDGNEDDDEGDYDEEYYYDNTLNYNYVMRVASRVAPAIYRYERDEDSGLRSPAFSEREDPVRAEVDWHAPHDEDEDEMDANVQLAREASLHTRGSDEPSGTSVDPRDGGTSISENEGAPRGTVLPSRPKKLSSGLWTGKNWVDIGEEEHHTVSQDFPELNRHGVPVGGAPMLGKRVRKPARPTEAKVLPRPAIGKDERSKAKPDGGIAEEARTTFPKEASAPTGESISKSYGSSSSLSSLSSSAPSPPQVGAETKKPSPAKGRSKADQPPTKSNPRSRRETATPVRSQQESVEPEGSVTGSGRRPKRTIKPPRKYEDEGDIMEEQRERTPSGNGKLTTRKSVSPRQNAPGSASTRTVASDLRPEPPASASKKSTKARARKSDANKDAEADSPVASIEDEGDMDSSQKTVVDPEVAEALAKREEARKAKSEKMKAITKARWASGEMHSVMEKKKANNAAKKAALTAGATQAPIAIAPAPLNLALAPAKSAAKKANSGSASRSPAPITPTLGTFTAKGKGKTVIKPEPKKEPRAKVLAKQEGNPRPNFRARSTSMGGDGNASSDDQQQPKKLSEYEIFQQLSSSANLDDSDSKGTRARSSAYEGRRSGRGGSLGGVGMERTISDDGASHSRSRHPGTPMMAQPLNRSKTLPKKMSEYEMFQQISSPSAAGSPLPPRGRRPAALRASQTFGRFNVEDDVEEETVPYAGPPGHVRGHSRTQSLDTTHLSKAGGGTGKAKKLAHPKVKEEENDEDEDSSSDDDEPKKKTKYDEWQEIIQGNGSAETEEGKRTRMRKSDVGGSGR